jgi:hypothetical protein
MNRFNEGKACDAIIRHLETREGGLRQDVRSPERAGHRAPVELTCMIGAHRFAFEHTGIEPFEGQIELETQAHFHPLRDMFSGPIPPGEQYELQVPFGATLTLPKAQINSVISALGGWIRREGPKLTLAPIGRYGTPAVRQPDAIVPFKAALYRNSLPGAPGHLLVTHRVDELDDSRPGANLTIFSNPSRNLLHVTYPKTRVMPWGDTKIQQPSRYVSALLGVGQV